MLGRVTAAANYGGLGEGRDSAPQACATLGRRERALLVGRRRCGAHDISEPLGGHSPVRDGDKWRCGICRKVTQTYHKMVGRRCVGSAVEKWALRALTLADKNSGDGPGHTRVANGRLVWCYCCGAYAEHWSVGLSKPCTGRPRRWTSNAAGLSRLIKGMHPKSSVLLVDPPVLEIWCEQIVRHLSLAWRDTRVFGKRWGVETAP